MPFQFFHIPVRGDQHAVDELNQFLRSHRILKVEKEWVDRGLNSFWAFSVDYRDGAPANEKGNANTSHMRVDYKKQLTPEQFELFSNLRAWQQSAGEIKHRPTIWC